MVSTPFSRIAFIAAITVAASAFIVPAQAAGPQNATCKANFPNYGPGWLTFEKGKPVAYRTNSYTARRVSRSGNTIRIDKARLKVKRESAKTIVGDWKLGNYRANNLKFRCK